MGQLPIENFLADAILALGTDAFAQRLHFWLRSCLRIDNITIVAFFSGQQPRVFLADAAERRVFERMDSHYVTGAYLLDPFYALHVNKAVDGLYRLADIAPDQFHRNEYYKSYYRRTTLADEIGFFSSPSPDVSLTVSLGRDASTGSRFPARDLDQAQQLSPVVNALVRQNWSDLRPRAGSGPEDAAEQLRRRLASDADTSLSRRQAEIALLILQGHSSVSIGLTLGISPQTVKVIRKQLYRKCHISSQGELYYLIAPYLA